jgi:hypothetical protein
LLQMSNCPPVKVSVKLTTLDGILKSAVYFQEISEHVMLYVKLLKTSVILVVFKVYNTS